MGLFGKKADNTAEVKNKEPKNAKKSNDAKDVKDTKNAEPKVSIFEKNRKLAKAKSTMTEFKVKDYWYVVLAIILFILLKIFGSGIRSAASDYCDEAKSSYDAVNRSISHLVNGGKKIELVEVHDPNVIDPSDRHREDDAYIVDWMKPIFNFNSWDEYETNRETMRKRFSDSYVPSADMAYFLQSVMPAANDLVFDENKDNLIAKMSKFTSYLVNIEDATDTYTYLGLVNIVTVSPNNGREGQSSGDKGPNYCVVYKVAVKDGEKVLRGIRFVSIDYGK